MKKIYMTPAFDVVELETQGTLLAGSDITFNPVTGEVGTGFAEGRLNDMLGIPSSDDDLMKMLLP